MRRKILFDLDGTLIDSRQRLYQLFCTMVPESHLSFDEYWDLKRNKTDHAAILSNYFQWPEEKINDFKREWLQLIEQPEWLSLDTVFEGVYQVMQQLNNECDLYLFTARQSEEKLLNQLQQLNLLTYFKKVFVTQQKINKEDLIKESNLVIHSYDIAVGDTGADINLGKSIGCISIAVTSGFCSEKVLEGYHPDYVLHSICDSRFLQICLS